jgi:hypothetical protein
VEGENGVGEVWREFPFLRAVDRSVERVVEVKPFIRGRGLAEKGVVLEGLFGIRGEAV